MRVKPILAFLPPAFRSWCVALLTCMALLNMLDLRAQVAYAYGMPPPRTTQQQDNTPGKPLDNRISLQVKDEYLDHVLEKIEKQTPFVFVYSNDMIKTAQRITLDVKDKQLSEVLPMLLSPLNVSY